VATYGRIRHVAEVMAGKTGRFVAVGGFATYRGFIRPQDLSPTGLPIPVPEDFPLVADDPPYRRLPDIVRCANLDPFASYSHRPFHGCRRFPPASLPQENPS
jgi:hypothetical protein